MTHYICTGTCGGVADKPGVCQAATCPMHGKPLVACNCTDGKHNGLVGHEVKKSEETKNNVLIIGLLTLMLGLVVGYFIGTNHSSYQQMPSSTSSGVHGAIDGMMSGLEGKTGDALDLAFLDGMIVHHEGAVEMATLLLQETKRPELVKLGNDIITAQTQEIATMKQWLKDWFNK